MKTGTAGDTTVYTAHNEAIEEVDTCIYLGAQTRNDGDRQHKVRRRIAMAKTVIMKHDRIWRSHISTTSKLRLITSMGLSVMLYGCESWLVDRSRDPMEAFELWCVRKVLDVTLCRTEKDGGITCGSLIRAASLADHSSGQQHHLRTRRSLPIEGLSTIWKARQEVNSDYEDDCIVTLA